MALCPGLEILGSDPTIVDFLSYPTYCFNQFWVGILAGLFIIIAMSLYNADRERLPKADLISSLGVSAIATISIALVGTLIGFIEKFAFIEILVGGLVIIAIWMFKD